MIRSKPASRPMTDRAIYLGFAVVGLFIVILAWLFTDGRHWNVVAFGYLAAVAYLINFYACQVYSGKHLDNWQQALARVPLRFVGYGTRGGKPLEAAHHRDETKKALGVSIAVSLAILAGLALILIPGVI